MTRYIQYSGYNPELKTIFLNVTRIVPDVLYRPYPRTSENIMEHIQTGCDHRFVGDLLYYDTVKDTRINFHFK